MASHHDSVPPEFSATSSSDNAESRRQNPSSTNILHTEGSPQRPRDTSTAARGSVDYDTTRYHQAHQPINDAVTSAFNSSDASSTAGLSPDLLQQITAQITANVLQHLKASNLSPPSQQQHTSGPHMDANSSAAGSPPPDRTTVYTPPSPYRASEDGGVTQPSPQFPPPSNQSSFRATSPPFDKRGVSPLSHSSRLSESEATQDRTSRPKGPKRISTGAEVTTLERVWGTLFDEEGRATERLGQFLRGVATHLIEDYEPRNSLVVTPPKLQRYYEETKVTNELYPWKIVFDDRTSSISRMYREIGAQHHLVQEKLSERPDIPGLTPQGFETWATLLLKAHPDQEFERLAKTALNMPISNPENRRERFPKELSRRLFPGHPDQEIAGRLQRAMSTHCNVSLPPQQSGTTEDSHRAPYPNQPSEADTSQKGSQRPPREEKAPTTNAAQTSPALSQEAPERQRQPQADPQVNGASATTEGESADRAVPLQIERERKPYSAAPGGGKTYDNFDKPPGSESKPAYTPGPPQQEVKPARSNSVHGGSRSGDNSKHTPAPIAIHQRPPPPPLEVPEMRRHRSNSSYHRDQPRAGRHRSPSMAKETGSSSFMRRSDADIAYGSPSHPSYFGTDPYDDARRYREYEAHRERLANDRYDAARMAAYDPRERERDREGRPRMGSVSAFDGPQSARGAPPPYSTSAVSADEDYYRDRGPPSSTSYNTPSSISTGFQPPPSVPRDSVYGSYPAPSNYPPSSYRDMR
ncbi:hypothetical protein ABEF95_013814 [Exophiala dermatitidis]